MVTAGNNGSGRIHPHQRNANFTGTIIGDHIELDAQHVERVQLTEQHSIDATTKRGHRNRIRQIYVALEEKFPEYYALVRDNAAIHMSVKTNILRMFYGRNGDYTDLSFRILFFTLPTRSLGAQSYRAYVY